MRSKEEVIEASYQRNLLVLYPVSINAEQLIAKIPLRQPIVMI